MHFAVVGDLHGDMDGMIEKVSAEQERLNVSVEFVLQVGDFEAIRHDQDFISSFSDKEKTYGRGDFPDYFSGSKRFPFPVYFISGNHEAWNALEPLCEGGSLTDNCTYLGWAGNRDFSGMSVSYFSGIYSEKNYGGLRPPWRTDEFGVHTQKLKRFRYFREADFQKVVGHLGKVDLLLLHDWPAGVFDNTHLGYGNPIARSVIEKLKPKVAFCGHIHSKKMIGEIKHSKGTTRVCALNGYEGAANQLVQICCFENGEVTLL